MSKKPSAARRSGRTDTKNQPAVDAAADRKIEILEAAREILAFEGYPKFTLRRVAGAAGMHLKTLQYYFSSKKLLLTEVVRYTLDHYYYGVYLSRINNIPSDPLGNFMFMVDHLLDDLADPFTTLFFFELWALAARDEDAAAAIDTLYDLHRHHLTVMITRINPELDKSIAPLRAALVAAQVEGLLLFLGHNKPYHVELEGLKKEARARILDCVMAPGSS